MDPTEYEIIQQVNSWRAEAVIKEYDKITQNSYRQAFILGMVEGADLVVKTVGLTYIASQVWRNLND